MTKTGTLHTRSGRPSGVKNMQAEFLCVLLVRSQKEKEDVLILFLYMWVYCTDHLIKMQRKQMTHVGERKCDVHCVRHHHQLTAVDSAGSRHCSPIRVQVHLLVFLLQRGTEEN